MNHSCRYQIHPDIAWVNESGGRIRLVIPGRKESTWLEEGKSLLWHTLWLGYDPEQWNALLAEEGESLDCILSAWEKAGWIQAQGV